MIKAVIFDLDGVLTKTDHLHTAAWRKTCNEWGIPFQNNTADLLRGVSRMESVDIILHKGECCLSKEQKQQFAEEKNNVYVHLLDGLTENDVFPGVVPLLDWLRNRDIQCAVASSSKNARKILVKIKLITYFSVIIDGTMLRKSKPDPEVFQKAVDGLHLRCEDCLVVEDAVSGIQAACRIGCPTAGLGPAANAEGVLYPLAEIGELYDLLCQEEK